MAHSTVKKNAHSLIHAERTKFQALAKTRFAAVQSNKQDIKTQMKEIRADTTRQSPPSSPYFAGSQKSSHSGGGQQPKRDG